MSGRESPPPVDSSPRSAPLVARMRNARILWTRSAKLVRLLDLRIKR